MKLISIIIPCFNVGKYIKRCYHSLTLQKNVESVEFIFVNDGSADDTLSILQDIKSKDNRVEVINQKNAGVSAARNAALEIAKGKYVYLLDGDDYLTENALYELEKVLLNFQPDLLISAYNICYNNEERFIKLPFEKGIYNKKDFFTCISYFPTTPQLVYRKDIIKNNNIYFNSDIKCGEVYAFTVNYLQYIDIIYILDKPTFNYFQRIDSATHKPNYNNDITIIKALHSIYDNGNNLINYGSFVVTAFRLMRSFTYSRYLKNPLDEKAIETLQIVLSDKIVEKCIKDTLYKPHRLVKERLMALYIYVTPKLLGMKFLNYLLSVR